MNLNWIARVIVILLVVAAVVFILLRKRADSNLPEDTATTPAAIPVMIEQTGLSDSDVVAVDANDSTDAAASTVPVRLPAKLTGLPRLVDLGADKCIPCKKMAPILEALREDFAGQFEVVFVDVWKNRQAAEPYELNLIPTQIFFDEEGDELFRHEGFFSRDDILATWSDLGYAFGSPGDESG